MCYFFVRRPRKEELALPLFFSLNHSSCFHHICSGVRVLDYNRDNLILADISFAIKLSASTFWLGAIFEVSMSFTSRLSANNLELSRTNRNS